MQNHLLITSPPISLSQLLFFHLQLSFFSSGDGGGSIGHGSGGCDGGGGGGDGEEEDREHSKEEALLVLAEVGRSLDNLPADLVAAIKAGRLPSSIVRSFFDLEKSAVSDGY